ncbi:MAG: acyl-CoA/acyl-ACP dehydrogenase [Actinomycetota bacterium]|nr:acyl-CoA/acyl-ACP dehydrogenase [Acidimicrobiia bacterium]MDQ3148227.1 acyl-CoA/acyl-ACP dehydrogenase [Actinomycetota bacterium]
MDFSFNEEQEAVRDLARQILTGQSTHERLKELETSGEALDRRTWDELAKANLLGIAVPEVHGGSGLGFLEVCLLLEQVGATTARVPVLPTLVMGALPITEFGSEGQRSRWLPAVVTGEAVLSAALVEVGAEVMRPTTTAKRDGDGWRLDGVKVCVPAGLSADCILVPAATAEDTVGVFLLDPSAHGVELARQDTTSGVPEARLEMSGALVGGGDVLGDPAGGSAMVAWLVERTTAGLCATATGVCEAALRMTAEYTKTREQFDKVIATFQAVGQRAADAYIDTEAVRLTAWQAAWRLSEGLPAAEEVAVAKFWAAEGGQRVVHAAQHLHGGIGVDRDYPLHRYFLWAKQLELTLGGATSSLLRLGRLLADEPV